MKQSREFIVASILAYIASLVSIFMVGTDIYWERPRLILGISYLPFWVVISWASYLAYQYLTNRSSEIREKLAAFGVNTVVFLGWLGVLLAQFSVLAPHA